MYIICYSDTGISEKINQELPAQNSAYIINDKIYNIERIVNFNYINIVYAVFMSMLERDIEDSLNEMINNTIKYN